MRGVWAKNNAQDGEISTARSTANDAWNRAINAQGTADSAWAKADEASSYATREIVNLTARMVSLENRVRRLEILAGL